MLTVADCISDNNLYWTLIQTEMVSSALRNILSSGLTNQMMDSYPVLNCIILLSQLFQTLFELFFYCSTCIIVFFVFCFFFIGNRYVFCASTYILHDNEWKDCLSFLKTYDVNIFRGGGGFYHILCAIFKRRTCQNN